MAGIWMNSGERSILDRALYQDPQPEWYVALFSNNHTPVYGDEEDASDYTECDFDGYARILLENWLAITTIAGVAQTSADEVAFEAGSGVSGTNLAYGYYVMDASSEGTIMFAELFADGPFNFDTPGKTRRISILVTLRALGQT